jgi:glyoxylase-like metal-dependent hydrolase (beta-lactamase superfamily II)
VFYVPQPDPARPEEPGVCFCGDLIFQNSVGRTDLPGSDPDALVRSIKLEIYSLPGATRLLPGHGAETTVDYEKTTNPFVDDSPLA